MDQQTLLTIMAAFVVISAIALCIQAGFLFGIFKGLRNLEVKTAPLIPKLDALIESSRLAIEESRTQIHDITQKTGEILDVTRRQLSRVDEVLEDAAARARVQMDRAEMVLDDTMNRAQETVALVHSGIMKPLREIQGVQAGVRAALNFLMRGRHNGPVATADEEMFI
jgi:ABC-type transporter Mla subunit MlaD